MSGDLREYECKHGIFERLCPKCSGGDNQAEMSNNAKLKYRIAELEKELKSYAHFGSEDDSLVSRLLCVYNSGGIERDFTKDGHFVPTINKEAAHRIKELEQQLSAIKEFVLALSQGGFEEFKFNDSNRPITPPPQEVR